MRLVLSEENQRIKNDFIEYFKAKKGDTNNLARALIDAKEAINDYLDDIVVMTALQEIQPFPYRNLSLFDILLLKKNADLDESSVEDKKKLQPTITSLLACVVLCSPTNTYTEVFKANSDWLNQYEISLCATQFKKKAKLIPDQEEFQNRFSFLIERQLSAQEQEKIAPKTQTGFYKNYKITSGQYTNPLLIDEARKSPYADLRPEYYSRKSALKSNPFVDPNLTSYGMNLDLQKKIFSLGEFMRFSEFDPEFGYYSGLEDHLGFGTIATFSYTQYAFAATILVKGIDHWIKSGKPEDFVMLELSGGNGTLSSNILSISELMSLKNPDSIWSEFFDVICSRTIEISESLSCEQSDICSRYFDENAGFKDSKFNVILGDACASSSWEKIRSLNSQTHFTFSNELLDMLITEFYMLSDQGNLCRSYVQTTLNDFESHIQRLKEAPPSNENDLDELEKYYDLQKRIDLFNQSLINQERIIALDQNQRMLDKDQYRELLQLFKIFDWPLDGVVSHQIVSLELNLTPEEESKLRENLLRESGNYLMESGRVTLFRDNSARVALDALAQTLPNNVVFHFDYFYQQKSGYHNFSEQSLRFYGSKVTEDIYLIDENLRFKIPDPHNYDMTFDPTVPVNGHGYNLPRCHREFLQESQCQNLARQVTKSTTIDFEPFYQLVHYQWVEQLPKASTKMLGIKKINGKENYAELMPDYIDDDDLEAGFLEDLLRATANCDEITTDDERSVSQFSELVEDVTKNILEEQESITPPTTPIPQSYVNISGNSGKGQSSP